MFHWMIWVLLVFLWCCWVWLVGLAAGMVWDLDFGCWVWVFALRLLGSWMVFRVLLYGVYITVPGLAWLVWFPALIWCQAWATWWILELDWRVGYGDLYSVLGWDCWIWCRTSTLFMGRSSWCFFLGVFGRKVTLLTPWPVVGCLWLSRQALLEGGFRLWLDPWWTLFDAYFGVFGRKVDSACFLPRLWAVVDLVGRCIWADFGLGILGVGVFWRLVTWYWWRYVLSMGFIAFTSFRAYFILALYSLIVWCVRSCILKYAFQGRCLWFDLAIQLGILGAEVMIWRSRFVLVRT